MPAHCHATGTSYHFRSMLVSCDESIELNASYPDVCAETKSTPVAVLTMCHQVELVAVTSAAYILRAHLSISPTSGARGLQRSVHLKSFNVQKWEIRFTLGLSAVKNTDYMKKIVMGSIEENTYRCQYRYSDFHLKIPITNFTSTSQSHIS